MSFLLFHLKRIVLIPYEFFVSPNGAMGSVWRESGKGRALLLGLPAILFAIAGIGLLCWAEYGMSASLENRYMAEAEKSGKEKERLASELTQELRMVRASNSGSSPGEPESNEELIPEDDPRRVEYEKWLDQEEVYWQKLIDLNPQEPAYRYRLAQVSMQKGRMKRGLALMNLTAPLDEPGYIDGHLWLAKHHWRSALASKVRQEAISNAKIALRHLDQSLKRDSANLEAKRIKALILYRTGGLETAYRIYEELFRDDVLVFKQMVEINDRLIPPRDDRNVLVLEDAVARLQQNLNDESLDDDRWRNTWNSLTSCYRKIKDFATIEGLLLKEIEKQSAGQDASVRHVYAERLLATVYLGWSGLFRDDKDVLTRLGYLKKAHVLDETNAYVLLELTRMGSDPIPPDEDQNLATSEEIRKFNAEKLVYEEKKQAAEEARSIYNPASHKDANALVLNELGSQALGLKRYAQAIDYFERAKIKSPKSSDILNNLSYTYLVGSNPNPKRALKLVDEALRFFNPKTEEAKKFLSHFHDTRGLAMMKLNRLDEAAAEFEIALSERPNNTRILQNLVDCYQANGLDPSGWVERLKELDRKRSVVGSQSP